MQFIIDFIVSIFGLGRAVALGQRDNHARYIARTIWVLAALILAMVGLNYFGIKGVNLFIALILNLLVLTIASRPEALVATAVAGATAGIGPQLQSLFADETPEADAAIAAVVAQSQTMLAELRKFFFLYFRTVGDVIFWISIFALFLGTISCENNPGALLGISIALIVIGYGSYRWDMGPIIYKWIIYNYAIFTLVVSILSLVPADVQIHCTGHDLGAIFHRSEVEKVLMKVESTQAAMDEKIIVDTLNSINEKIEHSKSLSEKEQQFLTAMKEERQKSTLPARIADKLSQISLPKLPATTEPTATPAPTPAPAPTYVPPPAAPATPHKVAKKPAAVKAPDTILDTKPEPTSTPKFEVKRVDGKNMPHYYLVQSFTKTSTDLVLNCAYGLQFEGKSNGSNTYIGKWKVNNVPMGPFDLSFSGEKNASGSALSAEGQQSLSVYPI